MVMSCWRIMAASQERQQDVGEGIGTFDLGHVPGTWQQMHLSVRIDPFRLDDVAGWHNSVAGAPDD